MPLPGAYWQNNTTILTIVSVEIALEVGTCSIHHELFPVFAQLYNAHAEHSIALHALVERFV